MSGELGITDRYKQVIRETDGRLFHMLSGHRCIKCGVYLGSKSFDTCYKCGHSQERLVNVDLGYYFGHYDKFKSTPLSKELSDAKKDYNKAVKAGKLLIMLAEEKRINVDYIVPVPKRINSESNIEETKILAEILAIHLKVEMREVLYFNSPMRPMKEIDSFEEREENIRGKVSFDPSKGFIYGEVGLVDDILTAGNTKNECAKVLKGNGASKVYVICVGRTVPEWEREYVR